MKYQSAFDIIGPVMVGPSSSHTAGAVRIGNIVRQVLGEAPRRVRFELAGSFAETYRGHGTDLALLAGVLGLPTDSEDIPNAEQVAAGCGLAYEFAKVNLGLVHPNTVLVTAAGASRETRVLASSIGGGKVEVQELDGLPLKFSGERPTLILYHEDRKGFLATVSRILDGSGYNIARLALERRMRGGEAVTVCEVDEPVQDELVSALRASIPVLHDIRLVYVE
ncbi:L-serine ammonia-lyase, iron-sulfur-dependent subunit beta [Alicyclobacillus sp.]|uniref:L-serine ammonia-lyase, iron-sulfur-dependent subunit beta n=1 Tax=Alicyclobacillus sp. TaxID=61169 RepID=UPI0025C4CCD4|nr:L-serine ammonia-lyase, iron-sulfur-dependent subunit beta [Alicyclobacillus sp.]MCL6517868.1 L-serine ammonia-lyase, iron-sulfur-dependent subunit beta [Alicyclobacillus sp.]